MEPSASSGKLDLNLNFGIPRPSELQLSVYICTFADVILEALLDLLDLELPESLPKQKVEH